MAKLQRKARTAKPTGHLKDHKWACPNCDAEIPPEKLGEPKGFRKLLVPATCPECGEIVHAKYKGGRGPVK